MSPMTTGRNASEAGHKFYCRALEVLDRAGVPFLVGGAYAVARYTGIKRDTKDIDIFVVPEHRDEAMAALRDAGYRVDVPYPHWLAKAWSGAHFLDIIYGAGNGLTGVDQDWFEHAVNDIVLGVEVRLVAPEEMIWSKAFVQERERYDGADIAHLLRALAEDLDWDRLLRRFGENWRVLLGHLILFGFVYPGERERIPMPVMRELVSRLVNDLESPPPPGRICHGTLLSREQYLTDIQHWGYEDARLHPTGKLTQEETDRWTSAIDKSD